MKCILGLLLAMVIGACAETNGLMAPESGARAADKEALAQRRPDSGKVDRLEVYYVFEYGYMFDRVDGKGSMILASFANDDVKRQFTEFFSRITIGKRTYCDCIGEFNVRDYREIYIVRAARLFEKDGLNN